ncbi:MAG: porin [Planctomycetota bacterium]|nr:porin [Planctomycetota bacterium]
MKTRQIFALSSGLLLGVTGVVHADATSEGTDVKAEVAALRARVNELEGKQSQTWLNAQRAEEVKALVKDVLADADTRSSLMANGMTAGHNGTNFFLASEDNNFLLNISGLIQARYEYANRTTAKNPAPGSGGLDPEDNENLSGFEVSRTQLNFFGHVVSPAWTYYIRLATGSESESASSSVFVQRATIGYDIVDNVNLAVGRQRAAFLKEEMIDDGYQLAVDRSNVNQLFSAGYVEGLFLTWNPTDSVRIQASLNDGIRSGEFSSLGYASDGNDITVTARGDVKLMGDWKQAEQFSAWNDQESALFVGAAVNYQLSQTGDNGGNNKDLRWTIDGQYKTGGLNVFAAIAYRNGYNDADTTLNTNSDQFGAVVQAGYFVIPDKFEPFARYEYLDLDNTADPGLTGGSSISTDPRVHHVVTGGANYYFAKQRVKATVDAGYAFNSNTGALSQGFQTDVNNHGGQFLVRGQVQLMF